WRDPSIVLELIKLVGAFCVAVWVVITYFDLRYRELQKSFLEAQLSVYKDYSRAVGEFVSWPGISGGDVDPKNLDEFSRSKRLLLSYYASTLALVKDESVTNAAKSFQEQADLYVETRFKEPPCKSQKDCAAELRKRAEALNFQMQKSIQSKWD